MSGSTSLKADDMIKSLRGHFSKFTDRRDPLRVEIPMEDFFISGYAVYSLKFSSLLNFETEMKDKRNFSNMKGLFGVERIPSDTRMREVIDEVETEELRPCFKSLFARAQRSNILAKEFSIWSGHYLLSVDGTGYYSSDSVCCEQCLVRKVRDSESEELYHHQMLCGAIVKPGTKNVIPVCPEAIQKQDGRTKNDCERNAMKRFLLKYREDHPKLKTILLTDALHATLPHLEILERMDMNYILSVKPGSHETLFKNIDKWETLSQIRTVVKEDEIGEKVRKKRIREYRFTNGIVLANADVKRAVNFLDFIETIQWVGKRGVLKEKRVHYSWITDLSIFDSNCEEFARAGRTRWKIENETFNTLKNQGYEFEHNFGHGYKNLSVNMANLMMLAFTVDQLQALGCSSFKRAYIRAHEKISSLWEYIKGLHLVGLVELNSWEMLYGVLYETDKWVRVENVT
jgi:predicted transposase YbfD/YdcC